MFRIISITIICFLLSCNNNQNDTSMNQTAEKSSMQVNAFGKVGDSVVHEYVLKNENGMEVRILDYGGTIRSIIVPDKNGDAGDVVLGFDSIEGYLQKGNPYFGCIVGRYANRIAKASFTLDGKTYKLAATNGVNSLHGGVKGFDKVIWKASPANKNTLELTHTSPDGDEGYPGNLEMKVVYSLSNDNELKIEYYATTDKATPVNLTNHAYFNLSAGLDSNVLKHLLMIKAKKYTVVNDELIPTGELKDVAGGPMDFKVEKPIGKDLSNVDGGYDHNWVLDKKENEFSLISTLHDPASGRFMETYTTEPGVQFYVGNFLDGTLTGKGGVKYGKHAGMCLETQHFPDSPNQPSFPNVILKPGETYRQTTSYKFSVK